MSSEARSRAGTREASVKADRTDDDARPNPSSSAAGCAVADAPACLVMSEPSGEVFEVEPGQAILDAALAQGVVLAHGCRHGVCGACAIEVVDGVELLVRPDVIEANSLQRFRLPANVRLACRARTCGPLRIRPHDEAPPRRA